MSTYTATASGNWSTTTNWTPTAPTGGPSGVCNVVIPNGFNLSVDSAAGASQNGSVTIGTSAPSSGAAAPTFAATGGASATSLPTGNYIVTYTNVDSGGVESSPAPDSSAIALTNGTSQPLITLGALPSGVTSRNVYITNTAGAAGTEHLYATGVTASTYNPTSASWNNGTQTYAAAAVLPTASALDIQGSGTTDNGTLTVNAGCTLTVRGDILLRQTATTFRSTFCPLTVAAGGSLYLDASASVGTTGTIYQIGPTQTNSPNARVLLSGSSGSHVTVASVAGGGNARFSIRGFTTQIGQVTATYADFTNIGDASNDAFQLYLSGANTFSAHNCTFTGCGPINLVASPAASSVLDLLQCTFSGSLQSSGCIRGSNGTALTTGTRQFKQCVLDQPMNGSQWLSLTMDGSYFKIGGASVSQAAGAWASCRDAILTCPNNAGSGIGGAMTGCMVFSNNTTSNSHQFVFGNNNSGATVVFDSCIFEEFIIGDNAGNAFSYGGSAFSAETVVKFVRCINLPNPGNGAQAMLGINGNSIKLAGQLEHCTLYTGGQYGMEIAHNESVMDPSPQYTSVQGNIFWTQSGLTSYCCEDIDHSGTATGVLTDIIDPTKLGHNCQFNITATVASAAGWFTNQTHGYGAKFSTSPGSGDLFGTDPQFVDSTRNVATFDSAYLGNTGVAWQASHAYAVGDIVQTQNSGFYNNSPVNFRCVAAHTSAGTAGGSTTTGQPGNVATTSYLTNWEFVSLYRIRNAIQAGTTITDASLGLSGASYPVALRTWVQYGLRPTNAALAGAGNFLGDAATVDASGLAWSGGANADIGAMSVLVATTAIFADSGSTGSMGLSSTMDAGSAGLASAGLSWAILGDSGAVPEAWLATVATAEYAADLGAGFEAALAAISGTSSAYAADSGSGFEASSLLAFSGESGGSGGESGWTSAVVASAVEYYWVDPYAARVIQP